MTFSPAEAGLVEIKDYIFVIVHNRFNATVAISNAMRDALAH